jgi:choline dehydrogenase-like flavoprotein
VADPGYLTHPHDLELLRCGMRTARGIVQRHVERRTGFWCWEVFPGPLFAYGTTQAWFDFYARMMSNTYFHACGTCAMDTTNRQEEKRTVQGGERYQGRGVVDVQLKVHGVEKLRIADASVIPAIPSSPTQAVCMLLGTACGDLILHDREGRKVVK